MEGHLDFVGTARVTGWAWDPGNPDEKITIDLKLNDKLLGSVRADRFRTDLLQKKKGDGKVAFSFCVPDAIGEMILDNSAALEVSAFVSGTRLQLKNSPQSISDKWGKGHLNVRQSIGDGESHSRRDADTREVFRVVEREFSERPFWQISKITLTDRLEVEGNILFPGGEESLISFAVNGEPFDEIVYPIIRKEMADRFWFLKDADRSGFVCSKQIESDVQELEICVLNTASQHPFYNYHSYYLRRGKGDGPPMPPRELVITVAGSYDPEKFLLNGFSTFRNIEKVLWNTVEKKFGDFDRILDWGCGCGRITRYFQEYAGCSEIWGADVVKESISWCSINFPFGKFYSIPLFPPTDLPDAHFDLVLGLSVFTHLDERTQFKWLEELWRITKDGGLVALSIQSQTSIARLAMKPKVGPWLESLYLAWRDVGFVDVGANRDLEGYLECEEYYRSVFHSRQYIEKCWGNHFKILDIVPGVNVFTQDLVLLQKN